MRNADPTKQIRQKPRSARAREQQQEIRLSIPSILGFEWIAMDCAAAAATLMQFPQHRIEDLKTAVGEACLNAIEHGNRLDAATTVDLVFTLRGSMLQVEIHDKGKRFVQSSIPHMDDKIEGKEQPRGWGIFLIQRLVDTVQFQSKPKGGNVLTLVLHLDKEHALHAKEVTEQ
jgi:serine/threonine-protein kinase RsbW